MEPTRKILKQLSKILFEYPSDTFASRCGGRSIKRNNYCIVLGECDIKNYLLLYVLAEYNIIAHKNIVYIPSKSTSIKYVFIGFCKTAVSRAFTRNKYIAKTKHKLSYDLALKLMQYEICDDAICDDEIYMSNN